MNVPLLDLKKQYETIKNEIDEAIQEVLDSAQFILGEKVKKFENNIADYNETKYAIGVASGTDALLLSLKALDIGPGDEVILPTFTFFATAGVISRLGATPVFVDIKSETLNMDMSKIKSVMIAMGNQEIKANATRTLRSLGFNGLIYVLTMREEEAEIMQDAGASAISIPIKEAGERLAELSTNFENNTGK